MHLEFNFRLLVDSESSSRNQLISKRTDLNWRGCNLHRTDENSQHVVQLSRLGSNYPGHEKLAAEAADVKDALDKPNFSFRQAKFICVWREKWGHYTDIDPLTAVDATTRSQT